MKIKSNKTFSITKSNHIIIECNINSVAAKLIIDTGASNSCLDSSSRKKFNLKCEKSIDEASSANSRIDEIFYSKNNTLEINNIKKMILKLLFLI